MMRYYFTYGMGAGQPFEGGYTCVLAEDFGQAAEKFRKRHPDREKNVLNCASVYSGDVFVKTPMWTEGNYGRYEVEFIR